MQSHHLNAWADDAFTALSSASPPAADKWAPGAQGQPLPPSAFTIPPALLTAGSVERFGQVTPPEERSPAELPRAFTRQDSVPVEMLRNEALFPDHQLQALQDYQPHQQPTPDSEHSPARDAQPPPPAKRRRSTKSAMQPHAQADPASAPQDQAGIPQPPKRKRGRPKSQPQMVEAFTADGFPFHISSARQSHLEKNRVAAHKCRQRKKEYIGSLETRAREYTSKNKALKENVAMLREELLELKNEVLRHASCGFWAVDEYLTRCAGDLLGMPVPLEGMGEGMGGMASAMQSPADDAAEASNARATSLDLESASPSTEGAFGHDDYDGGFDLLEDMDEDEGRAV